MGWYEIFTAVINVVKIIIEMAVKIAEVIPK